MSAEVYPGKGWQMYCGECHLLCFWAKGQRWNHAYFEQHDHDPVEGKLIPPAFGCCPANVEPYEYATSRLTAQRDELKKGLRD